MITSGTRIDFQIILWLNYLQFLRFLQHHVSQLMFYCSAYLGLALQLFDACGSRFGGYGQLRRI